jgi:hypothetical protein
MQMLMEIIGLAVPLSLLLFVIGAIAGVIEALIKTWNSSDTSFAMLRLRRYAISALVAIVGCFASIVYVAAFDGPDIFLAVATTLVLLTPFILVIMFFRLMEEALGYKKRFRRVYLLSVISIAVIVIYWMWLGYGVSYSPSFDTDSNLVPVVAQ